MLVWHSVKSDRIWFAFIAIYTPRQPFSYLIFLSSQKKKQKLQINILHHYTCSVPHMPENSTVKTVKKKSIMMNFLWYKFLCFCLCPHDRDFLFWFSSERLSAHQCRGVKNRVFGDFLIKMIIWLMIIFIILIVPRSNCLSFFFCVKNWESKNKRAFFLSILAQNFIVGISDKCGLKSVPSVSIHIRTSRRFWVRTWWPTGDFHSLTWLQLPCNLYSFEDGWLLQRMFKVTALDYLQHFRCFILKPYWNQERKKIASKKKCLL